MDTDTNHLVDAVLQTVDQLQLELSELTGKAQQIHDRCKKLKRYAVQLVEQLNNFNNPASTQDATKEYLNAK